MSTAVRQQLRDQWQLLRNRLSSRTARFAGLGVILLSAYGVSQIWRAHAAPGPDAMATFAAVDVGLLIALAIETFSSGLARSTVGRRATVGGRTMPASFALMIGLIGTAAHTAGDEARSLATAALLLTASGVLSVIYSALDRAESIGEHE